MNLLVFHVDKMLSNGSMNLVKVQGKKENFINRLKYAEHKNFLFVLKYIKFLQLMVMIKYMELYPK